MNNNPENGVEKTDKNFDSQENTQPENEEVSAAEDNDLPENDSTTSFGQDETVTQERVEVSGADETQTAAPKTSMASNGRGSSALPKFLALIGVLIAVGAGLVLWKNSVGSQPRAVERVSKEEMELILQDVNPMMLRQLSQNPEAKKELANNVAELFAIANQAKKEGLANDLDVRRELENFEIEILATNYDKAINQDKGPMPPFGFISEERMQQFWDASDTQPGFLEKISLGSNSAQSREEEFEKFLASKLKILGEANPAMKDRELTEEERKQAREYFAKTRIYAAEALAKKGDPNSGLPADFFKKAELQTKLQRAQFLARLYTQKGLQKKLEVTDKDIEEYIKAHPELGSKEEQRAKAEEILNRVKAGEDFAKLAQEFSEDPGSKDKGGLYEGITEGAFVPEFEAAVFSSQEGQIYPELVESNFGYHIIKVEDIGETKTPDGQTKRSFDARHILISTMFKDPENPMAREMPLKDYIRSKLEKEKEEQVLADIKKNNPVEVAEDFEVKVPEMPAQPELPPGMMSPGHEGHNH
jgi:parvulin-like peptidyl-prolyl isomerase